MGERKPLMAFVPYSVRLSTREDVTRDAPCAGGTRPARPRARARRLDVVRVVQWDSTRCNVVEIRKNDVHGCKVESVL